MAVEITYEEYIRILIDRSERQSLNNLESGVLEAYYELKKIKALEIITKFDELIMEPK